MRRIALCVGLVGSMGLLAAPAQATFHLNMVNEVMLASAGGNASQQFVEFLDRGGTEEQFTPVFGPYKLVVYDAAAKLLGQQTLNPSGLRAAAALGKEYLVSTPAVDAAFDVTGNERLTVSLPLAAGQVCFAGNEPAPKAVSCMSYGTITKPVPTNSFGTGTVHGPVPANGESDQRQPNGTVTAALPTPKAPNRISTTNAGKPTESNVSLTGLSHRKAELRFTVDAGGSAPPLTKIVVSVPRGLRFSKKSLASGIAIKGQDAKALKFSVSLTHGKLVIKLHTAASKASVTIRHAAIIVSRRLAKKVKNKKVKKLLVVTKVTDAKGKVTKFTSQLAV